MPVAAGVQRKLPRARRGRYGRLLAIRSRLLPAGFRSDFRSSGMRPAGPAALVGEASATGFATSASPRDAINRRILEVSEDRVRGFVRDPMRTIAELSGIAMPVVIERIRGMLEAGTIRRVRQTLLATNLAQGALIAWKIDESRTDAAFDYIASHD